MWQFDMQHIRELLTRLGIASANPIAFLIVPAYALLWVLFDPHDLRWHGAATLATWFMTLLIQRAEHRDTQAIHAKLDELLRAERNARESLAAIDQAEPEQIERLRERERRDFSGP
jgi:low affinity Fe/Cu permease